MSCTAEILTATRTQIVAIPIQALVLREKKDSTGKPVPGDEEEGVFTMNDGKAVFHTVRTGITGDLEIEAVEGVSAGDQIITGPFKTLRTLKDADRVVVQKEGQATP